MTGIRASSHLATIVDHLWDNRRDGMVSTSDSIVGYGRSFVMKTSSDVRGSISYDRGGSLLSVAHLGDLFVNGDEASSSYLRNTMAVIQIMHMLRHLGVDDEPVGSRRTGWAARMFAGKKEYYSRMHRNALLMLDESLARKALSEGVFGMAGGLSVEVDDYQVTVSHPSFGEVVLPEQYRRTANAMMTVLGANLDRAISTASKRPPAPPTATGSGRLTRVMKLCHEAMAAVPDLADETGVPIRPLVEEHLPELFLRHAAAVAVATDPEIHEIDRDLEDGIAVVVSVVKRALALQADDRRRALGEQIAFLEMRHPTSVLGPE